MTNQRGRLIRKAMIPLETAQANRRHRELLVEKKQRVREMLQRRKTRDYGYKETSDDQPLD